MLTPLGKFSWQQLNTTDADAALTFYSIVCGWGREGFQPAPQAPTYEMWTANGVAHSGVMQMPPEAPSPAHWLGYISTPNVDVTVAKARSLGATVRVPVTDIPTVGRFAVLSDPDGAMFAPFEPSQSTPDHAPALGDFSWFELATRDYTKALRFYGLLFGWTAGEAMDMGPQGIYQLFCRDGQMIGGMYTLTTEMRMPPAWIPYVRVTDLTAALARCRDAGGTILMGPHDVPGGDQIGMCTDPQSAMFALHWIMPR